MEEILHVVREQFGVPATMLVAQDTSSHNQHYIAQASGEDFHATLRRLRGTGDTRQELEQIADLETRIRGPTSWLVNTNLISRSGRYLEPFHDATLLAVRRHHGDVCRRTHDIAHMIGAALEHGLALDCIALPGFRLETSALRYAHPRNAFPAIRQRIVEFVALHGSRGEIRQLLAHLEYASAAVEASAAPPRFVHGDLSVQNLILDGSRIQVIDHDCLHYDHPLYDLAHLFLSLACSRYFSGTLHRPIAHKFLEVACRKHPATRQELCDVAIYTMLKKAALVRTPANLRIAERLAILDELRGLAGG